MTPSPCCVYEYIYTYGCIHIVIHQPTAADTQADTGETHGERGADLLCRVYRGGLSGARKYNGDVLPSICKLTDRVNYKLSRFVFLTTWKPLFCACSATVPARAVRVLVSFSRTDDFVILTARDPWPSEAASLPVWWSPSSHQARVSLLASGTAVTTW